MPWPVWTPFKDLISGGPLPRPALRISLPQDFIELWSPLGSFVLAAFSGILELADAIQYFVASQIGDSIQYLADCHTRAAPATLRTLLEDLVQSRGPGELLTLPGFCYTDIVFHGPVPICSYIFPSHALTIPLLLRSTSELNDTGRQIQHAVVTTPNLRTP